MINKFHMPKYNDYLVITISKYLAILFHSIFLRTYSVNKKS